MLFFNDSWHSTLFYISFRGRVVRHLYNLLNAPFNWCCWLINSQLPLLHRTTIWNQCLVGGVSGLTACFQGRTLWAGGRALQSPPLWQESAGFEMPPGLVLQFSRLSACRNQPRFCINRSGVGPQNLHYEAPRNSSSGGSQTTLCGALLQCKSHGFGSWTSLGWNPGFAS